MTAAVKPPPISTPPPITTPDQVADAIPHFPIQNIEKLIVPTIIKCNLGGFVVCVPGHGVAAKSTFEEAMKFLSEEVHKECFGEGKGLPVVLNKMYQKVTGQ